MTPTEDPRPTDVAGLVAALVQERTARGLSRNAVAKRMGSGPGTVQALEDGTNDPYVSTVQRYARAIGVRVHVEIVPDPDSPDGATDQSGHNPTGPTSAP